MGARTPMDLRSTLRLTAITAALVAGLSACTVDEDQEKALGMDAAAQIDRQLPFVTDPQVNEYISTLGNALASGSDDRALEWRFRVVDSEQVNAVALPGGFVYVNRGLIERAGDASGVAGATGPAMSHGLVRHSA